MYTHNLHYFRTVFSFFFFFARENCSNHRISRSQFFRPVRYVSSIMSYKLPQRCSAESRVRIEERVCSTSRFASRRRGIHARARVISFAPTNCP